MPKKHRIKKQFHPQKVFRLTEEVFNELKRQKIGTWNYFLKKILKVYVERER